MAKTVFKYTLEKGNTAIDMPKGAVVLSAHAQGESVCIWALVDRDNIADTERRTFELWLTGEEIYPEVSRIYIGTVLLRGGTLVIHVFEKTA